MKLKSEATYALLKAMHYANATKFFLEMVITESNAKREAKKFLSDLAKKAESITRDMKLRLTDPDSKSVFSEEMTDPLTADSLMNIFLSLSPENRDNFEQMGGFMLDAQLWSEKRKENGYSASFDERIAHPREVLVQHLKEMDRLRELIVGQLNIIDKNAPKKLAT